MVFLDIAFVKKIIAKIKRRGAGFSIHNTSTFLIPLLVVVLFVPAYAFTQVPLNDSSRKLLDTSKILLNDSSKILIENATQNILRDSGKEDSLKISAAKKSSDTLDAPVQYSADDSILTDVATNRVYLVHNAKVIYKDLTLQAYYITIDFRNKILIARGKADSAGNEMGTPDFSQGSDVYRSHEIDYNFRTKQGVIDGLMKQEGEGYLRGQTVKKEPDNAIFARNAIYTTCNLDHPHYYIAASKVKMIPGKLIVTGPANLVIDDVPTPLFLPFGIFPVDKGRASGLVLPSYGYNSSYGYYLQGLGVYLALSQHYDLEVLSNIYTYGGYGINLQSNYKWIYKLNGNISADYEATPTYNAENNTYEKSPNFRIAASFALDPKTHPNGNFSANINIVTPLFNQLFGYGINTVLNNSITSSMAYQRRFGDWSFLTLGLNENQNTTTQSVEITGPTLNFAVNTIYPFASTTGVGSPRWYEKIGFGYTLQGTNSYNTTDSALKYFAFNKAFNYQFSQALPVSASFTILKYFNITPAINFNAVDYFQTIRENYEPVSKEIVIDTVSGFEQGLQYQYGVSLTTNLYGLVQFKKGKIRAIRHVLTPTIGFSYHPDFSDPKYGYYHTVYDSLDVPHLYSIFSGGSYGGPPAGRFGGITFSLENNLEMKVRSSSDTLTGLKKIQLLQSLTLSGGYNLAVDTMQWQQFVLSAHTQLFNKIGISFTSLFDPYEVDSNNIRINETTLKAEHKLVRWVSGSLNMSASFQSLTGKTPAITHPEQTTPGEVNEVMNNPDEYVNFNVPWDISPQLTASFTKIRFHNRDTVELSSSLLLSGSLNITSNWKLQVTTSYDLVQKQFSYTTVQIFRDLHCWQMQFYWVPFGPYQRYSFTLNVKSSLLQDLKLQRNRNWYGY